MITIAPTSKDQTSILVSTDPAGLAKRTCYGVVWKGRKKSKYEDKYLCISASGTVYWSECLHKAEITHTPPSDIRHLLESVNVKVETTYAKNGGAHENIEIVVRDAKPTVNFKGYSK